VREAGEYHVLYLFELFAYRGIDARIGMAEQIDPPRADAIDIAPAREVLEPNALATANRDHRERFVILHLRAGVPHVRQIPRGPVAHVASDVLGSVECHSDIVA
jgi:hypothetical protein